VYVNTRNATLLQFMHSDRFMWRNFNILKINHVPYSAKEPNQ